jgi:ATP-dependent phosphoenolpyruvate carboxykinase
LNTEYYGQCKSWALGIAAAILEEGSNTLSIHGATASYKGKGVVIIAPTGTGKTTHSFRIFLNKEGKICGDDWAYVKFPVPLPKNPIAPLVAKQPERSLYMRSESEKEQGWLRDVFDRSLSENVTTRKEDCEYPTGIDGCSLTERKCVFNDGKIWCYYAFGNSRVLVKREDILGPDKVVDEVPINLVVLLRRDDKSPPEVRLSPDQAISVLQKGEYMVLPGAGPKEKWGTTSYEPWYNPYLLEPDDLKQAYYFRSMFETWKVPCVILNIGVESVQASHERIIAALESAN